MNEYDIPADGEEVKPVSKPAEYFSRFAIQSTEDESLWIGSDSTMFGAREKMRIFFSKRSVNTFMNAMNVGSRGKVRELIIVVKPEGE